MPLDSETRASFDAGISPARDPLAAAAASLAADAEAHDAPGTLIIVVRPQARDYRVVSGDRGNGALRAAVSVMVASENGRLWADVEHRSLVERPVTSLPEVVRAAADGAGVTAVHVATVIAEHGVGAVVLWFADSDGVPDEDARLQAIDTLDAAARRYLELAAEEAAADRTVAPGRHDDRNDRSAARGATITLQVGSDDPDVDPLTGLASKARFDRAIEDFDDEEATLLLIDLDHFSAVNDDHGRDVGDAVLREIALRLANACRGTDLVARLDADEFAILLCGADRHTGLQVSKRLLRRIAEPLPTDLGPASITATVAFAHEFGLVDMEELVELADEAISSGKRAGRARIVVTS